MIAAGSVISSMGSGFYFYGSTTFFLPISGELGLTRAATSIVFAVARLEGSIEGPIVGWLIDRYGAKKLFKFYRKRDAENVHLWILALAFILRLFVVGGIWVHMVPLLV